MTKIKLTDDCYVLLKDKRIIGPVKHADWSTHYPWRFRTSKELLCWNDEGETSEDLKRFNGLDIERVLSGVEVAIYRQEAQCQDRHPAVDNNVLRAAMDAGIKAKPAYEEFVRAIVAAAFAASDKPVSPVPYQITREAVVEALIDGAVEWKSGAGSRRLTDTQAKRIFALIEQAVEPQNESDPGSTAFPKTEGGQSGFVPELDGRPYHALEFVDRRFSPVTDFSVESVRSMFEHRNDRICTCHPDDNPPGPCAQQYALSDCKLCDQTAQEMRTLDKLHPATKSFLQSLYPDAPLRGVEFAEGIMRASYGRPMRPAAEITVGVSLPGVIPMWIDEKESAPTSDAQPDHGV